MKKTFQTIFPWIKSEIYDSPESYDENQEHYLKIWFHYRMDGSATIQKDGRKEFVADSLGELVIAVSDWWADDSKGFIVIDLL